MLLSEKEYTALKYIEHCYDNLGFMPTMQETSEHMGLNNHNSGQQYYKQLGAKGYLIKKRCHYVLARFK